jgi:hypothetical protein
MIMTAVDAPGSTCGGRRLIGETLSLLHNPIGRLNSTTTARAAGSPVAYA